MLPLSDGGALLSGSQSMSPNARRDAWVARVDRNGKLVWSRSFGNNSGDFFFGARRSTDGRFELFGVGGYSTRNARPVQALVVTLDEDGTAIKQQRFVQPVQELVGILPLLDSGYLLLGASLGGPSLVKINADGSLIRPR